VFGDCWLLLVSGMLVLLCLVRLYCFNCQYLDPVTVFVVQQYKW
jgi:hypothetical protein